MTANYGELEIALLSNLMACYEGLHGSENLEVLTAGSFEGVRTWSHEYKCKLCSTIVRQDFPNDTFTTLEKGNIIKWVEQNLTVGIKNG
jgi:hypothetical protein